LNFFTSRQRFQHLFQMDFHFFGWSLICCFLLRDQ
jgi:hypothetical protein